MREYQTLRTSVVIVCCAGRILPEKRSRHKQKGQSSHHMHLFPSFRSSILQNQMEKMQRSCQPARFGAMLLPFSFALSPSSSSFSLCFSRSLLNAFINLRSGLNPAWHICFFSPPLLFPSFNEQEHLLAKNTVRTAY